RIHSPHSRLRRSRPAGRGAHMSRERFSREGCAGTRKDDALRVSVCRGLAAIFPPRGGVGTGTGGGGLPSSGVGTSGADVGLSKATGAGTAGIGNLLPWLYPPADYKNFDKYGAVALPAIGTWADILVFSVEQGRAGKITQFGIDFVANGGAAYTQGLVTAQLKFFLGVNGSPAIANRPGKPFID